MTLASNDQNDAAADSGAAGRPAAVGDNDDRVAVTVALAGIDRGETGPWPGWTLEARRFLVQPTTAEMSSLLDGTAVRVDQGQPCAIVLDADLPAGSCELVVASETPSRKCYVSLYRISDRSTIRRQSDIERWSPTDLETEKPGP